MCFLVAVVDLVSSWGTHHLEGRAKAAALLMGAGTKAQYGDGVRGRVDHVEVWLGPRNEADPPWRISHSNIILILLTLADRKSVV